MAEFTPLKYYFGNELADLLAAKIKTVHAGFNVSAFTREVASAVDALELKPRVALIAGSLRNHLPQDYSKAISILLSILGPENPNETGMFKDYHWLLPVANFVEQHGLKDYDVSINAIKEITKRNTGEYAIRPFLIQYPEKTLKVMKDWSKNQSFHVRRLASEGIRPRLPWAMKLDMFIKDPRPIFPILENLKDDPSLFVRKSVANNLNDILKDNYSQAMKMILQWSKEPTEERKWILKHALRNQVKKNNREAIQLIKRF